MSRPTQLAEAILARLLPEDLRESILGDLAEELEEHTAGRPRAAGALWYWIEASRLFVRYGPRALGRRRGKKKGITPMKSFLSDLKYALRSALRWPSFTLVVVVTLALGIGINAAVFSVLDALLLRPFPIPDIAELVQNYAGAASGTGMRMASAASAFTATTAARSVNIEP